MDIASVFARTEKKFLMTRTDYEKLLGSIRGYMVEEQYHVYKICNIYYDTDSYDLFRLSAEKPVYKEKLRLRAYGTPDMDSDVFLEVKKKFEGVVYKRRIRMKLPEAYHFVTDASYTLTDDPKKKDINAAEIKYLTARYDLKPKVYVSYDREAYVWKGDADFRITFDTNMKYRLDRVGLENGDEGEPILKDDLILMELKCGGGLPLEMVHILNKLKIFPVSFSKIGTVYREHILKPMLPNIKKEPDTADAPIRVLNMNSLQVVSA